MTYLICNICMQIPFVEFLPSLMVKFTCCSTNLVRHFDLDRHIINLTNMKCSSIQCKSKSSYFHYFFKGIKCDNCLKCFLEKNKNKMPNDYIKYDLLPKTCKNHSKVYTFYDDERHLLFCEYCIIPGSAKKIIELQENCRDNLLSNFKEIKESYSKYYEKLTKIIIETYKKYGKSSVLNAYYNLLNLNNFLKNYSIIIPLCLKCKQIFRFNIKNDNYISKENKLLIESKCIENSFEISCKCKNNYQYNSIGEFEKEMNSIDCDNCSKSFEQKYILYDCISEKNFCEDCSKEFISLDYIRLNELKFICWIHKLKFEFYCKKCYKLFCIKCENINDHEFVKLANRNISTELFLKMFSNRDWPINLVKNGLYNLENETTSCNRNINIRKIIKEQKTNIIKKFEEKIGLFNIPLFEMKLELNLMKVENCLNQFTIFDNQIQITEMNNKLMKSEVLLTTLFKEVEGKSEIINLLKSRNVMQHLILEIIKCNYSSFEEIQGDFRILFEAYKYLNFELNVKKKEVKNQLEKLFANFENLIKSKVKTKEMKKFIQRLKMESKNKHFKIDEKKIKKLQEADKVKEQFLNTMNSTLPRIPYNEKLMLFNSSYENEVKKIVDDEKFLVLNEYNNFLSNQNMFKGKELIKFKEIKNLVGNLQKNIIPEEFEKSGFFKDVKIVGNEYTDKYGFICDKNINSNLIQELLSNIQKNEGYQYLILKKEKVDKFIKSINLENDMEFYFIYSLMNNLIKRIGNIIHQNDNEFNAIYNNISVNLEDIINYKLIKDNNKNDSFRFIDLNQKEIIKVIFKNNCKLNDFREFASNFISKSVEELKKLLGEKKINEMAKKYKKNLNDFISVDGIQEKIRNILIIQKNNISFLNDYKDLFLLAPEIKDHLATAITENYVTKNSILKNECLNIIEEDQSFNKFINYYINNYLFSNYLYRKIEEINNKYEEEYEEYINLLEKKLLYEYITIILEAYKKKFAEHNLEDIFLQEKMKTIEIFNKYKEDKKSELDGIKSTFLKPMLEKEVKNIEEVVKKMKNIHIDFINETFKNYLDHIDIGSYAYSKFDVILYLYQNNYI